MASERDSATQLERTVSGPPSVQNTPKLRIKGLLAILALIVWLGIDRPRLTSQIEMLKAEIQHKDATERDVQIAREAEERAQAAEVKTLEREIAWLEAHERVTEEAFVTKEEVKKQVEAARLKSQ